MLWLVIQLNLLKSKILKPVVWCISKYALPPNYGAQGRLFYISKELNKLGFESAVITSSTNHLAQLPAQSEIFKLSSEGEGKAIFIKGLNFKNSLSKNRILSWFVFEWYLFRFLFFNYHKYLPKPDVVFVSSISLLTILNGILAKFIYKCKLVFEVRDIWPLSAILVAGYSRSNPFILFLRFVEKLGYKYSDIIVSPLPNAKAHIERSINKKVNFVHLPQGVDLSLSKIEDKLDEDFVLTYVPKDKFIFGYIGNLVNAYDLESLINCARVIEKQDERIHFLILGDGTHKSHLMELSRDLNNVTFIPRIPKTKIKHFLGFCDVATNFLRPEPLFEFGVSPQKLVDYMLAGKPILMSYTGYKTLVEEVNCGIVVEAANIEKIVNAMLQLSYLSQNELVDMGNRGREFLLNNLSWENIVKKNISLFQK
jgi:glycosyltransferase involved in cell wall biosynthesis